jgi:hypothetical protein
MFAGALSIELFLDKGRRNGRTSKRQHQATLDHHKDLLYHDLHSPRHVCDVSSAAVSVLHFEVLLSRERGR